MHHAALWGRWQEGVGLGFRGDGRVRLKPYGHGVQVQAVGLRLRLVDCIVLHFVRGSGGGGGSSNRR